MSVGKFFKDNAVALGVGLITLGGLLGGQKVKAQNNSDNDDRSFRKMFNIGVHYSLPNHTLKDVSLRATDFDLHGSIASGKPFGLFGEVGYHSNHLGYGGRGSFNWGYGSTYYEWAHYDHTADGKLGLKYDFDFMDDEGNGISDRVAIYGQATSYPSRRVQDIAQCDIGAGVKNTFFIGQYSRKGWYKGLFVEASALLVNHENQTWYGQFNRNFYQALGTYPQKSTLPLIELRAGVSIGF